MSFTGKFYPPEFDYHGGEASTLGIRWDEWLDRFKIFMSAAKITDTDASAKATFLYFIGPTALAVYNTLRSKESGKEDKETYVEAHTLLTTQFASKRSPWSLIVEFRKASKRPDESVDQYVIRLRQLASRCGFGTRLDTEILTQLIVSANMDGFLRKVCRETSKSDELTLADAINYARGYERVDGDVEVIQSAQPRDRASIEGSRSIHHARAVPSGTKQAKCDYCGRDSHKGENCPAKGTTCHNCGKLNHFAAVCRSEPAQTTASKGSRTSTSSRGDSNPRNSQQRSQRDKKGINTIGVDAAEYAEYQRYRKIAEYGILTLASSATSDYPMTSGKLLGRDIPFLVDTGAPINVIGQHTYESLVNAPKLQDCPTKFYGLKATDVVPVLGKFEGRLLVTASNRKSALTTTFIVVSGHSPSLIGYPTSLATGLIKFCGQVAQKVERTTESLSKAFPNLFSGKLGCIKGTTVTLDVDTSVKPVRQHQRPVALHLRLPVERELAKQVAEGIIEPVDASSGPTPWVANLVVVPKGAPRALGSKAELEVRLTSDSRDQNRAIRRIKYPGKTLEDIIHLVNGATIFSKLDIMKAFHQLAIHESSRNLTTITTHVGLFRYKRLHMGISCASEIFTETIRKILLGCPGQLNMTDDILVHGVTEDEHHENLILVLDRLERSGITLNREKCQFYARELIFFGLKMSAAGIAPTEDRCQALKHAEAPTTVSEVRSLLGLVQYSSRFIRNLSTITEPLWNLIKKDVKWQWSNTEQSAFEALKDAITTRCMAFFNIAWDTEVIVDASPVGMGAILVQIAPKDQQDRRVICFASRLLTDTERRYSQCEKEALAAVWGCERYWFYLIGSHFTLVTDNRAVQLIFGNAASRPPARIERWALRLTQFSYTIKHCPGASNIADFFSRHPDKKIDISGLIDSQRSEVYVNFVAECASPAFISTSEMAEASLGDPELVELAKWSRDSNRAKCSPRLAPYKNIIDDINVTKSGIVLRGQRIVVPTSLRKRVVELAHSGHQGIVKTKALIRSRVWFPGIDAMVELAVATCRPCQATTPKQHYEPLKPSPMPSGPWQELSGDFYGPLSDSTYWFVNHDDYSRWASVDPIKSVSAEAVIPLLTKLFATFGTPHVYKSDNGSPFQSHQFAEFAKQLGFKHRRTTPVWPRANGEAESFMKKLGKVVRNAEVTKTNKLAELTRFLRTYRETPHSTTGVAPNMLLMGYSRSSGIPLAADPNEEQKRELHELAIKNDDAAKERMRQEFNRRMKTHECAIRVGQKVLVKLPKGRKSMPPWDPNPYTVTNIKGSLITAARTGHSITRNSSFFKAHREYDDEEDEQAAAVTAPTNTSDQKLATETKSSTTTPPQSEVSAPSTSGPTSSAKNAAAAPITAAATPVGTSAPTATAGLQAKAGRPNAAAAAANKQAHQAAMKAYQEERVSNPSTRISARLANKSKPEGDVVSSRK